MSFILKLHVGSIVFLSYFFIILETLVCFIDFYLELALLRLVYPRKWMSLLLLFALLVFDEQSLLLWVLIMRLRWLFCETMFVVPLLTRRMLLGCFMNALLRVLSHLVKIFYLFSRVWWSMFFDVRTSVLLTDSGGVSSLSNKATDKLVFFECFFYALCIGFCFRIFVGGC